MTNQRFELCIITARNAPISVNRHMRTLSIERRKYDPHPLGQSPCQTILMMAWRGFRPTLAAAFLGCSASAAWTLEARRGLRGAAEPADDPQAALVVRKGHEHEAACLAGLKKRYGDSVEIPSGPLKARFAATVDAMERGVPLIYQAALTAGSWLGYADFLYALRTAVHAGLGPTSRGMPSWHAAPGQSISFKSRFMGTYSAPYRAARLIKARSCLGPASSRRPTRSRAFRSTRSATMSVGPLVGWRRSRLNCRQA